MTEQELQELERLEAEATEGPWWWDEQVHVGELYESGLNAGDVPGAGIIFHSAHWETAETDREFIAVLRHYAKALIQAARERGSFRATLEEMAGSSWEPGVRINEPSPTIRFTHKAEASEWLRQRARAALQHTPTPEETT